MADNDYLTERQGKALQAKIADALKARIKGTIAAADAGKALVIQSDGTVKAGTVAGGGSGSDIKIGGTQPASGWWLDSGNTYTPPAPDTTAPTAGNLSVVLTSQKAALSVTGASDDKALDAAPYAFSKDNGLSWSQWQAAATYDYAGLASDTSYTFRHKVRDAAGNETVGVAVVKRTAAAGSAFRDLILGHGPFAYFPLDDTIQPSPATAVKNLGSGPSGASRFEKLTVGAPTLGDGATSVSVSAGGELSKDGMPSATAFTYLVLADIPAGSGTANMFGGWDTVQYQVDPANGTLFLGFNNTNANATKPASVTGRHLLVVSYDGSVAKFYMDTEQVGAATKAGVNSSGWKLASKPVAGRISSLAFIPKALTAADIQSLVNALPAA